jgi:hypothetical protein
MTSTNIEVIADHDGSLTRNGLREALTGLDVSKTSPLSASGDELGISVTDDGLELRVQGFEGEFTKTSEDGLVSALKSVEAVDSQTVAVTTGGYGDAGDGGDEDAGDE